MENKTELTLYVTVGLPYSGKSTWAKKKAKEIGAAIVNPDAVRLALHGQRYAPQAEEFVWSIVFCLVRSLFLAGHTDVIVDATNTTKLRRDPWVMKFEKSCVIKWIYIDTDKDECIKRAMAAKDDVIIPVIMRMADQFEPIDDKIDKDDKAAVSHGSKQNNT